MPSSYTLNNGIELIDTGEQSGTWGDTTNDNLSFIDTALDGQVTITASSAASSGSPNDLPITNGTASNGRNRLVEIYSGTNLGGTVYYQLTPNDAEKIIYIRNNLNTQDLIVFQGTYNASNDYLIPNGKTAVIFFNGTGSGAVAANVMSNAHFDALNIVGNAVVGGTLDVTSVATATTFEPDGDTAAGDNAAIGYTAAEGLILTGQGSTNDVTIKNDADADVLEIPTGTTNVTIAGNLGVGGTVTGTGTSVFASLDISGDIDVDGTTNLDVTNIVGDLSVTGDTTTFSSANAEDPLIIIKDTTNDANAARLRFVKDKGAAGADDDDIGTIEFFADNDAQEQTKFALIRAEVADASDGAEGGKLRLQIASHDGEMQNGLIITDGSAEDEIDVTIGNGTASVTTIAGTLTSTGAITSNAGIVVDNITIDGQEIDVSSGDLTIDVAGDITLNADGGDWLFYDGSVTLGSIQNDGSNNIIFMSNTNDKDIKFLGIDNSSTITALTLDMSDAGKATFNNAVLVSGQILAHQTNKGVFEYNSNVTKIHSYGASSGTGQIQFLTGGGGGSADSLAMTIDDSQNVGIGCSPASGVRLDIRSNATTTLGDFRNASATGFGLYIAAGGTSSQYAFRAADYPNNSLFSVMGDGNVGIGTISPTSNGGASATVLHIHDADENNWAVTHYTNGSTGSAAADGFIAGNIGSDVYLWNYESSPILFATNNSERMRINSQGNIGFFGDGGVQTIDHYSNYTTLTLSNSTGGIIQFEDDGALIGELFNATDHLTIGSTASGASLRFRSGAASEAMRIDSSGRVLIGHTSSIAVEGGNQKLQLTGTTSNDGISIARFNAEFGPYLNFGRSGSGTIGTMTAVPINDELGRIQWAVADGTDMASVGASISAFTEQLAASNDVPSRLVFSTTADGGSSPTERMRIDSSGNVGIGCVPSSIQSGFDTLQIGGNLTLNVDSTGAGAGVYMGNNVYRDSGDSRWEYIYTDEASQYLQANGEHIWRYAGSGTANTAITWSEAMRITSGGYIEAASASQVRLTLGSQGTAGTNDANWLRGNGTSLGFNSASGGFQWEIAGSEKMRIASNGTLLVGRTTAVSGTTRLGLDATASIAGLVSETGPTSTVTHVRFYNGNGNIGNISTNGSATTYATSSDYRLKENVVGMTGATDRLKQLNPSRFNFIADADTTVDGFLAHEVQAVVPEAIIGTHNEVDGDGNPVYQNIDQSKLVPLLVATIKELEARITALEAN